MIPIGTMPGWRKALALALLLVLCASAHAQSPAFRNLGTEDGLPSSSVYAIAQDHFGYIWFATRDGLSRYDGAEFVNYRHDPLDPDSLPGNDIQDIKVDGKNRLWIATADGGLAMLDTDRDRFARYQHDPAVETTLSGDSIWSLAVDQGGDLWVGTYEFGLNRLNPDNGQALRYRHQPGDPNSLGEDSVSALLQDSSGQLWIGGLEGLTLMDPQSGNFSRFQHRGDDSASIASGAVTALMQASDGMIWVGSVGGISLIDPSDNSVRRMAEQIGGHTPMRARALLQDRLGEIWIGTAYGAALQSDPGGTLRYFRHSAGLAGSLPDDHIWSAFEDREGGVWFGTLAGGVSRLPPNWRNFTSWRHDPLAPDTISGSRIEGFSVDSEGGVWVASFAAGVSRIDPQSGRATRYSHSPSDPDSLLEDRTWSVLMDAQQRLWVGSHEGLSVKQPGEPGFSHLLPGTEPKGLTGGYVRELLKTDENTLWIGTGAYGLNRLDISLSQVTQYRHLNESRWTLSGDEIEQLSVGPEGRLWIATNNGLDRLDSERDAIERLTSTQGLAEGRVEAFAFSPAGTLWVARRGAVSEYSLSGRQIEQLRSFGREQSEVFTRVQGMAFDDLGQIWLTTRGGLHRMLPETGELRSFGLSDGLPSTEFVDRNPLLLEDGRMLAGTYKGLVAFSPASYEENAVAPATYLTGLWVDGEAVPTSSGSIQLSHDVRRVRMRFTALSFAAPERNRIATQVEGLDSDWVELAGRERVLERLPSGTFTLRVRGANDAGVWAETPSEIRLVKAAPPWLSWWAIVAYAGALVLLLIAAFAAHRRRITRQHQIRRAEERLAWAERHRRLSQSLTETLDRETILERLLDGLGAALPTSGMSAICVDQGRITSRMDRFESKQDKPGKKLLLESFQALVETGSGDTRRERGGTLDVLINGQKGAFGMVRLVPGKEDFNARDFNLAIAYARQAGAALDNAQLLEEVRELAQRAQSASQAKSEFLATMSHEIRTPMNGVLGMTELLLDSPLAEEQRAYAQSVFDSGKVLLSVLNDVLDLSKIEAGKLTLSQENFDLGALMGEVTGLFAAEAGKKDLEFAYVIDPEAPRALRGDPTRIRQVLLNLLGNAFKFTQEGCVQLEVAVADATPRTADLRFEVVDSGIGIVEEELEQLFEPFVQADSTVTRDQGGTGLGLAICRRLVELMGGKITANRNPTKGSRFAFTVHLGVQGGKGNQPQSIFPGASILVADPWEVRRRALSGFISRWGAECATFERIGEAQVWLETHSADALIVHHSLLSDSRLDAKGAPLFVLAPVGGQNHSAANQEHLIHLPLRESELLMRLGANLNAGNQDSAAELELPLGDPPLRILVVDEDEMSRTVVEDMCRHMNHEVQVVECGRDALRALLDSTIDVVVTNCNLPDISGPDLAFRISQLHQINKLRAMPRVVAVSADVSEENQHRCAMAGMTAFVAKPVSKSALRGAICDNN